MSRIYTAYNQGTGLGGNPYEEVLYVNDSNSYLGVRVEEPTAPLDVSGRARFRDGIDANLVQADTFLAGTLSASNAYIATLASSNVSCSNLTAGLVTAGKVKAGLVDTAKLQYGASNLVDPLDSRIDARTWLKNLPVDDGNIEQLVKDLLEALGLGVVSVAALAALQAALGNQEQLNSMLCQLAKTIPGLPMAPGLVCPDEDPAEANKDQPLGDNVTVKFDNVVDCPVSRTEGYVKGIVGVKHLFCADSGKLQAIADTDFIERIDGGRGNSLVAANADAFTIIDMAQQRMWANRIDVSYVEPGAPRSFLHRMRLDADGIWKENLLSNSAVRPYLYDDADLVLDIRKQEMYLKEIAIDSSIYNPITYAPLSGDAAYTTTRKRHMRLGSAHGGTRWEVFDDGSMQINGRVQPAGLTGEVISPALTIYNDAYAPRTRFQVNNDGSLFVNGFEIVTKDGQVNSSRLRDDLGRRLLDGEMNLDDRGTVNPAGRPLDDRFTDPFYGTDQGVTAYGQPTAYTPDAATSQFGDWNVGPAASPQNAVANDAPSAWDRIVPYAGTLQEGPGLFIEIAADGWAFEAISPMFGYA